MGISLDSVRSESPIDLGASLKRALTWPLQCGDFPNYGSFFGGAQSTVRILGLEFRGLRSKLLSAPEDKVLNRTATPSCFRLSMPWDCWPLNPKQRSCPADKYQKSEPQAYMLVSLNRGTLIYRPQNTIVLIIGPPKWYP